MPSITKEQENILNDLADPEVRKTIDPSVLSKTMTKLGVDDSDVEAWGLANQNRGTKEALGIRNKIFDKLAASEPGETTEHSKLMFAERFVAKNLVDNDPVQQRAYLESLGYDVRNSINGDLQVRPKGSKETYTNVDPEGFDRFDLTDFAWEVGTGLAQMVGAGIGGAGGSIGGPPSAVLGASAGSATGGAVSESFKQGAAIIAGARREYDPKLILEAAEIGAAMPVIGNAIQGTARLALRGIVKGFEFFGKPVLLKNNHEMITDATKAMGGRLMPSQVHDNRMVAEAEDMLLQNTWTLAGQKSRGAMITNRDAAKKNAALIVDGVVGKSPYQIGSGIYDKMVDTVEKKLAPARAVYEEFENELGKEIIPDKMIIQIKKAFGKTINEDARTNREAHKAIYSHWDMFNKKAIRGDHKGRFGVTINDVRNLRTDIGQEAADAFAKNETQKGQALMSLYERLTDARSEAIEIAFSQKDPLKGKIAAQKMQVADKLYAKTMSEVENLLGTRGKKLDSGPNKALEIWSEKVYPQDRVANLFPDGAIDKAKKIKEDFPEVFELMRLGEIENITRNVVSADTKEVMPVALKKALQPYLKNPEKGRLIFGDDGFDHIKKFDTFIASFPSGRLVGPSGTPGGSQTFASTEFLTQLVNPLSWAFTQGNAGLKGALLKGLTSNTPGLERNYIKNSTSGFGYMIIPDEAKHDSLEWFKDKVENIDLTRLGGQ